MAITAPPVIDVLPAPPDPNDRSSFNARAYPWSVAQQTFAVQVTAVAANVFDNASNAMAQALKASDQAAEATVQAGIATSKAGQAESHAAAASIAAANAISAFDQFDDRYLGSRLSDPVLDNDGNALLGGALYWNATVGQMRVYTGSSWDAAYLPAGDYLTPTDIKTVNNVSLLGSGNVVVGDVAGPASASNGGLAVYSGTSGKSIGTVNLTGLVKLAAGVPGVAAAGSDYLAPPSGSALLKANAGGALANAVAGTDYVSPGGAETLTNKTLSNPDITTGLKLAGSAGTSGQALVSQGPGAAPAWVSLGASLAKVIRTGNTQLTAANNGNLIDITSGTFTQTFAAAATLGAGWWCYIRNSGSGAITLDPSGSELIDGLSSYVMYPGEARLIQCDGTGFVSIVLQGFLAEWQTSGTFVKPPGYQEFLVDVISAGSSGAKNATGGGRGGGGGGRFRASIHASALLSSNTVTVGAGGVWNSGSPTTIVAGGDSSIGPITVKGASTPSPTNNPSNGGGLLTPDQVGLYVSAWSGAQATQNNGAAIGFWGGGSGGFSDTFPQRNDGGGSFFAAGGGGGCYPSGSVFGAGGVHGALATGGGAAYNAAGVGANGAAATTSEQCGGGGGSGSTYGGNGGFPGGGGGGGNTGGGNGANGVVRISGVV